MIPVVIVGLGRVGAGNEALAGALPLSHLAAARATKGLAIAGLADPDPAARERARRAFGDGEPPIAAGLDALPVSEGEVIVLATPSAGRGALLAAALARRPRLVVVEKPFAASLAEGRAMEAAAIAAGVPVWVNFNRRHDARHRRWRARAPKDPLAIVARYNNGLFNYASHLVDLLLDWYGPVAAVQALGGADKLPGRDCLLSFRCRMTAGFDALAIAVPNARYDLFEVEVFGADACLNMCAGGAEIRLFRPAEGRHYRGYRHLAAIEADEGPVGGFAELYAAVRDHIVDRVPIAGCDAAAAVANLAVLEAALSSVARGGAEIVPEVSLLQAA